MEVINGFVARVYTRKDIDELGYEVENVGGDTGQLVEWEVKYFIRRFPKHLAATTSVNYLFSPNFKYQLDYLYDESVFVIRECETQDIFLKISKDMIRTESSISEASGREAVAIYASRINFVDDDHIKIINENQLECIFKIIPDDNGNYIELRSSVHIDNLAANTKSLDCPHLDLDPALLNNDYTLARLIRKN